MISDTQDRRSIVPRDVPPNFKTFINENLMDINSLSDAINSFSDQDKQKLIEAVQQNQARLEIQGMISSLLDSHCFDQCVKSTKSLTGAEKGTLNLNFRMFI